MGFGLSISRGASLMYSKLQLSTALGLAMCFALCGCGTSEVTPKVVATKQTNLAPKTSEGQIDEAKTEVKAEDALSSSPELPVAEEKAQIAYEAPYPDRENLFLIPKRSAKHKNTPGSIDQSVELLGFANVKGPRVILSINGNVVPLAVGGQELGIEVISIQPPAVVLQRDRDRWQATLEN